MKKFLSTCNEKEEYFYEVLAKQNVKCNLYNSLEIFNGFIDDIKKKWAVYIKGDEKEYRNAIRLDSMDAVDHCNLGMLLKDQGRLEEAESEYRTAIELDPRNTKAYNNL